MTIGDIKQEHFTRPKEEYDALLRVARVAKDLQTFRFNPLHKTRWDELKEALKEVEYLL